jgi:hypothetical protein
MYLCFYHFWGIKYTFLASSYEKIESLPADTRHKFFNYNFLFFRFFDAPTPASLKKQESVFVSQDHTYYYTAINCESTRKNRHARMSNKLYTQTWKNDMFACLRIRDNFENVFAKTRSFFQNTRPSMITTRTSVILACLSVILTRFSVFSTRRVRF